MDEAKPKRRAGFRFSLRTLFVAVTLFGIWLGLQMKWIRDRHSYLAAHPDASEVPRPTDKPAIAPGFLGLFGEAAQTRMSVQSPGFWSQRDDRKTKPSPESVQLRKLFPEAIIEVMEGHTLYYTWDPGKNWDWGKR